MKKIILITGETGALMTHAMLHSCTPEKFDFVEPEPFMITNPHKYITHTLKQGVVISSLKRRSEKGKVNDSILLFTTIGYG